MAISVRELTPAFGAEARGFDIAAGLEHDTFQEIRDAFEEYSVLVFPDQDIDDAQQVAFSRRFGALEETYKHAGNQNRGGLVVHITNVEADGSLIPPDDDRIRFRLGNRLWHSDSSFKRVPATASLLSGREVPPEGGQTEFASLRAAYAALPKARRDALDGLVAIHHYANSRRNENIQVAKRDEDRRLPPVPQAVVRANPVNGRKGLYLGAHAAHIVGMPEEEGRSLLEELLAFSTQRQFVYSHEWRPKDLVMYDNRCVLHRVCPYEVTKHRRVMHRTTVAGVGPTAQMGV